MSEKNIRQEGTVTGKVISIDADNEQKRVEYAKNVKMLLDLGIINQKEAMEMLREFAKEHKIYIK